MPATTIPQHPWDMVVQYIGHEKTIGKHFQRDWRFEECRACVNRLLKNMILVCTGWTRDIDTHIAQVGVCRRYAEVIATKRLTRPIRSRAVISELRIYQKRGAKVDRQRVAMIHTFRACAKTLKRPMDLITHPRLIYIHLLPYTRRVR